MKRCGEGQADFDGEEQADVDAAKACFIFNIRISYLWAR
jgi:hypothetical protein